MKNDYCILLFAYNRPSHLKRVIISLENYREKNIYVILDGPRISSDRTIQSDIKKIVYGKNKIKLNLIENKKNLGLAQSINKNLDYFAKKFKNLIILEDDCIPRKEFFRYIKKAIEISKNDNSVAGICGYQLPHLHQKKGGLLKIYKLKHFIPWGWSIKSKEWVNYRRKYKIFFTKKNIENLSNNLKKILKKTKKNKKNIWSKDFILFNYKIGKYFLFPSKSLVKNIGFDGTGVNSKITNIFYTKYFQSKKISDKIYMNKKMISLQEKCLENLVDYYY